jgi:DNA polymerase (family 10)
MDAFADYEDVEEVESRGATRSTAIVRGDFQVDLRVVDDDSYGAALHYFTGSKDHGIACRQRGIDRGLKLNEYGLFDEESDERVAGQTEEEIYERLDMSFVPPELREDRGEVEAAADGALPELVELDDLRGDLHCHTTASDGKDEIGAMAEAARERGLEYLAITDHSRSNGGLGPDDLGDYIEAIREVDDSLEGIDVLAGCEVDILSDGALDLPDEALAELDYVICSVHSDFDLGADEQTGRLVEAIRHPHTMVLGHPLGRIIGGREALELHFDVVLEAAREHRVALELDAQPERLDLDDIRCKQAREAGVPVVLSSDAHSTEQLRFVERGIHQARRGWLEADDILNTRRLDELLDWFER